MSLELMSVHGSSWVLMAALECSWLLLPAYEFIWVLTGAHKCLWWYMSTHEQPWTEHSWAWFHWGINTHESLRAVMSLAPWGHRHSSALMSAYGTISAHEFKWVPMAPWPTAHDCSWALMRAPCSMAPSSWVFMAVHEYSWLLLSVHGCS